MIVLIFFNSVIITCNLYENLKLTYQINYLFIFQYVHIKFLFIYMV